MKMCSVGKFIRIIMDRKTIKLPSVMKNYNFHLFITTGFIFVWFPIGWFQLVANHLIAKQFFSLLQNLHCPNFSKVLFIRIDIPNFPKSDILIDWYRNSNISVTAGLVSSLKFLIEWYSLVEEDCIEVSFILIRASFHPDPDCPKNPRSSFNFGWSRFWYSEFSLTTGSISSVKDSIDCFQLWLSNLIENCWFWSVHLTRDSRITTYSAFIIDSSRILKLHFFVTIGLTSSIKVSSENFTLLQEDSIEKKFFDTLFKFLRLWRLQSVLFLMILHEIQALFSITISLIFIIKLSKDNSSAAEECCLWKSLTLFFALELC